MIELGKKQTLEVVKKVEFGVYLAEEAGSMDSITRGSMVTITLDKKGNATYVLVTSSGMKFM